MMLEVGKLYSCSKYFLMLYPDRETAASARAHEHAALAYGALSAGTAANVDQTTAPGVSVSLP